MVSPVVDSLRLLTACVSSTRISVSSLSGNNALEETPAGREISGVAGKLESLLWTTTAVVLSATAGDGPPMDKLKL